MVLHLIIQKRNVIKSHHLINRVPLSEISAPPRLSKYLSVHQTSLPQYQESLPFLPSFLCSLLLIAVTDIRST